MQKGLSAAQKLLLAVIFFGILIGSDRLARFLAPRLSAEPLATTKRDPINEPAFKVGDLAPDFTLADSRSVDYSLSDLLARAGKDTLLCFTCGCSKCLDVQTYLGILCRHAGPNAPNVISVTTMPEAREATYRRDTKLKQTILFDHSGGSATKAYKGHPCPRLYGLKADRTVAWIGMSPKDATNLEDIGNEMAAQLGMTGVGMNEGPAHEKP